MSAPRPPLRLVGSSGRDAANPHDDGFEPVHRDAHDFHPPYRELEEVGTAPTADDGDVEPDAPRTPLSPRFVVVALIVFQLLAASTFLGKYVALTRSDDQYRFAAVVSVAATLCLVVGAVLLALRPGRGRALFIAAAVGFGMSLPAWGVGYGWSWPIAFGAMLALAGAWFARDEVRPDAAAAAQP